MLRAKYDDGGFSGGNTDRPALQRLLEDVRVGKVDVIVVYKVDRLTRSLADFAKLVELFDAHNVSFVSVTQQFNTTTSMGRLTLNVLLSFAQFEREVTSERIRDSRDPGPAGGATPIADVKPLFQHPPIRFAADSEAEARGASRECCFADSPGHRVGCPRRFCLLFVYYPCPDVAGSFLTAYSEVLMKSRVLNVRERPPTSGLQTLTAKTGVRVP